MWIFNDIGPWHDLFFYKASGVDGMGLTTNMRSPNASLQMGLPLIPVELQQGPFYLQLSFVPFYIGNNVWIGWQLLKPCFFHLGVKGEAETCLPWHTTSFALTCHLAYEWLQAPRKQEMECPSMTLSNSASKIANQHWPPPKKHVGDWSHVLGICCLKCS